MVTGALARNRKNRKRMNYQNGNKVKILSGNDITLEKIYSRHKNGCLVCLKGLEGSSALELVDKVNWEDKTISVVSNSADNSVSFTDYKFNDFNNPKMECTGGRYVPSEYASVYKTKERLNLLNKILENNKTN